MMDEADKKILDVIQSEFPLQERPYKAVGERLGLSEDEVLSRVRALRKSGIIRRIGANFQSKKLGWVSTLCAAKVPVEKLEEFSETVNAYSGVTHNYLRDHEFNVWFTFIAPSMDDVENALSEIEDETGVKVLNLPASKMFKIKVDFKMGGEEGEDSDQPLA
jgi:DNA-binding Lrp family transcriptional regulator